MKLETLKTHNGQTTDGFRNPVYVVEVDASSPVNTRDKIIQKLLPEHYKSHPPTQGMMGDNLYGLVTQKTTASHSSLQSLTLQEIEQSLRDLCEFARENPNRDFLLKTKVEDVSGFAGSRLTKSGYPAHVVIGLLLDIEDLPKNLILDKSVINYAIKHPDAYGEYNTLSNDAQEKHIFSDHTSPFSMRYPSKFTYKGRDFVSVEHFLAYCFVAATKLNKNHKQYLKLTEGGIVKIILDEGLTGNDIYADSVLSGLWRANLKDVSHFVKNMHVGEAARINRTMIARWAQVAMREKFDQNQKLADALMATEGKELVYAHRSDLFWGAGVSAFVAGAKDRSLHVGDNNLGKILGATRSALLERRDELDVVGMQAKM